MITIETILWGALAAAGGGILYSLKSLPIQGWRKLRQKLIYTVKIYQYDDLFDLLEKYMAQHYKSQYKDVEGCLEQIAGPMERAAFVGGSYVRSIPIPVSVRYKQEENTFIIKWKGKRVFVRKAKEKLDHVQNTKDLYFAKFILSGWKAKSVIEDLLEEAVRFSKVEPEANIVKVHANDTWGDWEVGKPTKVKPLEKVILPGNMRDDITNSLERFLESEEWYEERGIPYKRGYCLYGPPGTGKTTLALAIAHKLGRSVRCLNLNSLQGESGVMKAFREIPENSILLIEDIDKVFSGRENVRADSKISFSTFINCLDGAFYKHGLITIITTNHIDKLDEALLRTGRIDEKIEVPKPSSKEINLYMQVFYNKPSKPIKGKFAVTMSDVQEICLRNHTDMVVAYKELMEKQIV